MVFAVGLAGSATASTLLQVIHLDQGQNINTILELQEFDEFDASDLINDDGDLLFKQVAYSDTSLQGCEFGSDTSCDLTFEENVEYVLAKANSYVALYATMAGMVHIDTSEWGDLVDGGLVNGGGRSFLPAISDVRGIAPIPEPSAAIVFAAGSCLVGGAIRRRRAR
jgi:hypothetical protein